jgi:hypothetical protein
LVRFAVVQGGDPVVIDPVVAADARVGVAHDTLPELVDAVHCRGLDNLSTFPPWMLLSLRGERGEI